MTVTTLPSTSWKRRASGKAMQSPDVRPVDMMTLPMSAMRARMGARSTPLARRRFTATRSSSVSTVTPRWRSAYWRTAWSVARAFGLCWLMWDTRRRDPLMRWGQGPPRARIRIESVDQLVGPVVPDDGNQNDDALAPGCGGGHLNRGAIGQVEAVRF